MPDEMKDTKDPDGRVVLREYRDEMGVVTHSHDCKTAGCSISIDGKILRAEVEPEPFKVRVVP